MTNEQAALIAAASFCASWADSPAGAVIDTAGVFLEWLEHGA